MTGERAKDGRAVRARASGNALLFDPREAGLVRLPVGGLDVATPPPAKRARGTGACEEVAHPAGRDAELRRDVLGGQERVHDAPSFARGGAHAASTASRTSDSVDAWSARR